MEDYEKFEEEAQKKLKPQKEKMKISGKSAFLLEKLGRKNIGKKKISKNR